MKRHPALLGLSREHHGALKLARAVARAALSGRDDEVRICARQVVAAFADELDAHFRIEERDVLPALAQAGETEFVGRTLREHEELRALAAALRQPSPPALLRFGELLAAHVRFEERELFEAAQRLPDVRHGG